MKKKILTSCWLLTLALCSLAGCNSSQEAPSSSTGSESTSTAAAQATPVTATDFLNNTVTLEEAPQKIVSLTASNTEMLCELGLEDKLIGVDSYSDYPESVKEITIVGDYTSPDIEKIISLQPDIVFASNTLQAELISQLTNAGITVAASEPTSYEQLLQSVELIGSLGGAEQEAIEEVQARIRQMENEIKALAGGEKSALLHTFLRRIRRLVGGPRLLYI